MKQKIIKFLMIVFFFFLSLFLINRFVFSWAGLILSGLSLCEYKSINVPTENGHNKTLAQSYDLRQIASVMKSNNNYEVNDRASGGLGLVISRTFNGVKYNIVFDSHKEVYEFNLN